METMIRILIVDDQPGEGKCLRLIKFLKENNIQYSIALNLEEAVKKMNSENYNCIVLDRYFPEKDGEQANAKAAAKLLKILEEQERDIPVLLYSFLVKNLNSDYIKKYMTAWNPNVFQDFLETSTSWKKKK